MPVTHSQQTQELSRELGLVIVKAKNEGLSREQIAAAIVLACSCCGIVRVLLSEAYDELQI